MANHKSKQLKLSQGSFPRLLVIVQNELSKGPACHDWDHTLRVLNNARHIRQTEGGDPTVVDYAAVLHDVARPQELANKGQTCHARLGARMAARIIAELGIHDQSFIDRVASCVLTHRYRQRNGNIPQSTEAQIIFDADKLDCIGAIGLGRAFHFAGRIGACVHNSAERAMGGESYSPEDSAYREYLVKLCKVKANMMTKVGRRMAISRHNLMVSFFASLNCEVAGDDFGSSLPDQCVKHL